MDLLRFVIPDIVGAGVWVVAVALTGFILTESWRVANRTLGAFGALVFLVLAVVFLLTWRRVRARAERELARAPIEEETGTGDGTPG
jgi:membrane protein DedA with SNARE-associated domain